MLPAKKHLIDLERVKNFTGTRSGYLRLDKNENITGFPDEFIDMLKREVSSDFLTAYPEVEPLYEKISKWLGCRKDSIYISSGSDAAIKSVFEVFVEPGDKIIILSPTYAMFNVYADMFQADLTEIGYSENLSISVKDLTEAIEKLKPKLLCIANPNSPTGTVMQRGEIQRIIEVAAAQNSIMLLDEAYYLFCPITAIDLIEQYPQLIVTRTFSKALGLASARLGLAVSHPETAALLHKVRPMYETNAFAVRFAEIVLDNYDLVEKNIKEMVKGKEFLERELGKLGISYFKSYTNFMLIDVGSRERSIAIQKTLYEKKILIKGGFRDNVLNRCIRVSIGNVGQMRVFLDGFKETLFSGERQA